MRLKEEKRLGGRSPRWKWRRRRASRNAEIWIQLKCLLQWESYSLVSKKEENELYWKGHRVNFITPSKGKGRGKGKEQNGDQEGGDKLVPKIEADLFVGADLSENGNHWWKGADIMQINEKVTGEVSTGWNDGIRAPISGGLGEH